MLRAGHWKYVRNRHDIDELYDLAADPREMRNLAALPVHAGRVAAMRHRIAALLRTTGPGPLCVGACEPRRRVDFNALH